MPGRWDFALAPNYAFYVAGFSGPNHEMRPGERADGWNEAVINSSNPVVKFVLSPNPGSIQGVVAKDDGSRAAGAPVFLEAYDAEHHHRLGELRTARTDVSGQFQFAGLAPGVYRLASTFENQRPDEAGMDAAGAVVLSVEEGSELVQNLLLHVSR